MTNKDQDEQYKSTLNLLKKFVESNQRKRISLLSNIESEVDNLFEIKTTIIPKFEIIDGQNFISYSTSYLESNQYFFKRIFDIFFTLLIGFLFGL